MNSDQVFHTIQSVPLVPVFYHPDADYAQQILAACYAGGMRAFELTNRGANALPVFRQLRAFAGEHCPGLALGIGTIYEEAEAAQFFAEGADFIVQPVTTPAVGGFCRQHDLLWIPGAMTLNEIYHCKTLGARVVKIFPGELVGPAYIKAIRGPLPGLPLMVTGGVEPTEESLGAWFGAGATAVGIGSRLFEEQSEDTAALSGRIARLLQFVKTIHA